MILSWGYTFFSGVSPSRGISTGLWSVNLISTILFYFHHPNRTNLTPLSQPTDRNLRHPNNPHNTTPQLPRHQTPPLPSTNVRGNRSLRSRPPDPRPHRLRPLADDDQSLSLYSGKSSMSFVRNCVLRSKSLPLSSTQSKRETDTILKTRFPESRYPGNFDLWGSHAIFHISVVCAAVVQLTGYLNAFGYAQANIGCLDL